MTKISAIIITKNEEKMLPDCLASVSFCDEVIVIDAGSSDKTVAVAKKVGAKVFSHSLTDYAEVRNLGLRHAEWEWVLYVDADERVSSSLRENIKYTVSSIKNNRVVAYRVKRKNFYFGNHEWPYVEKLERLFRKKSLKGWRGSLHESPIVDGEIGELDGFLLHYTHRNLSEMAQKTILWSKIEAKLRYDAGHPQITWWRFPRVMLGAFFNSYVGQSGWKAGAVGLIESMYQAFSIFITYARLWEMQNKVKSQNAKGKSTSKN